ncbi:MAG: DUF551 domain-containing protein [Muribaculaceae bacterium]|nr:DUF551 domain-containing protein [Muribaculaceae bacterium]
MTRFEKKEELIGLFSSGSILIGDMLDEAMDFAEKNIEKESTRKIVECSEFLAKLPHWISVEDELPKERDWYLIYDTNMGHDVCMWYGDCWGNCYKVTHWMPLPAPPEHFADVSKKTSSSSEIPTNLKGGEQ